MTAVAAAAPPAALRSARLQFAALGMVAGTWGAHIPSVQQAHGLNAARLSLVLFAAALGCVATLWFAGAAVARFGIRRCARVAALSMTSMLALALVVPGLAALMLCALLLGAGMAMFDVCINCEGAELERSGGRRVMSQLHGLWSVGAMTGALAAAALFAAGVAPRIQLGALALTIGATLLVATRSMPGVITQGDAAAPRRTWPTPALWLIGALVFAGMTAEGAMHDWTVLYLAQERHLAPSPAAIGYAVFSVAMALARFAGDALRERVGDTRLIVAGALLAASSMTLVLIAPALALAFAGLALVGAGVAPIAPILYNAAARRGGTQPAAAIAAVTAIGYGGLMLGPPLVGVIAQSASLTLALAVAVIGPALALAVGARLLERHIG
ncbi:MAG: MFS transporter [Burkholderiaceae bacterium]